jgi:hypothetical protein
MILLPDLELKSTYKLFELDLRSIRSLSCCWRYTVGINLIAFYFWRLEIIPGNFTQIKVNKIIAALLEWGDKKTMLKTPFSH